jgi:menaquinone-dependent protoporphyrinogen IX oxidase
MRDNGIIIYGSRYGAAGQYAKWAGEALKMPVHNHENTPSIFLNDVGTVVIITSIYMGDFMVKEWLTKNADNLMGKRLFVLLVGATETDKEEQIAAMFDRNIPPALSHCHRHYVRGKSIISELSFKDGLLLRIGAFFTKDPKEKESMLTEFNEVNRAGLGPLLADVRSDGH